MSSKLSRRDFLKLTGATAAAAATGGLTAKSRVFAGPNVIRRAQKVRIAVGGWAEQNMKDLLERTEFS